VKLKVVAWVFIAQGIFAALEIISQLLVRQISINLGIIAIFIGIGLLKLTPGWRTVALVYLWIGFILIPVFSGLLVFAAVAGGNLTFKLFGVAVAQPGPLFLAIFIAVIAAVYALMIWQYRVLRDSGIRALFQKPVSGRPGTR